MVVVAADVDDVGVGVGVGVRVCVRGCVLQ